jgi:hypothetical protein
LHFGDDDGADWEEMGGAGEEGSAGAEADEGAPSAMAKTPGVDSPAPRMLMPSQLAETLHKRARG